MTDDTYVWIEGATAVEAVLETGSREVRAVYIQDDRRDSAAGRIQRLARQRGIALERVAPDLMDRLVAGGHPSGVVAEVGPRRLAAAEALLATPSPVIFMLDGVEDPHNLGQAIRVLYAAGVDGLVLSPRDWSSATSTIIRASAGATEFMPTAVFAAAEEAATYFRRHGLTVACAAREDARPMVEVDLTGPLFLVIGGERRGITRSLLRAADVRVSIPYGRRFAPSLGTVAAAAVLSFEIQRQRAGKQSD